MTREEMNALNPGDSAQMCEFPHNDVAERGSLVVWGVECVYPADLTKPAYISRITATRPGLNGTTRTEFVAHYHAQLMP